MVFLSGVLVTAFLLGAGPAYFAAALAFTIYNFYLSRPGFEISLRPEDLLNAAMFLAVAVLTGSLTGRVRDEAGKAEARARATDQLFAATREFSGLADEAHICDQLVQHLAEACRGDAFVVLGERRSYEPAGLVVPKEIVDAGVALARERADGSQMRQVGGWSLRTLHADGVSFGVVCWRPRRNSRLAWWRPRRLSEPFTDAGRFQEIIADAGSAALGRARLAAEKADAEARARTEDLRNALLSSISHDLRTPLAAIMASASSLSEFGDTFGAEVRQDLATTIQEEAERLDTFVANLLNMTRLEAGALKIQKAPFNVQEVVRQAVERRVPDARRLSMTPPPTPLPEALGDPVLFEQALGNVIENALRYTPDEAVLAVSSRLETDDVVIEVRDGGPGLPEAELKRIFDKFYRSPNITGRSGTGLGLSIARGLMDAMDGSIAAHNRVDAESGLVVTLRLAAA
jgi:two-component system sensor histidine kinase KdpD